MIVTVEFVTYLRQLGILESSTDWAARDTKGLSARVRQFASSRWCDKIIKFEYLKFVKIHNETSPVLVFEFERGRERFSNIDTFRYVYIFMTNLWLFFGKAELINTSFVEDKSCKMWWCYVLDVQHIKREIIKITKYLELIIFRTCEYKENTIYINVFEIGW